MAEVKLFYGNEPYRLMKKREALKKVENPEMNLYITEVFDQGAYECAYQIPFLARERVIIVDLENCSNAEMLIEYLQKPVSSTNLYVFVNQMDKKSALAKAFPAGSVCEIRKYTEKELDDRIRECVRYCNKSITDDAREALKERMQYFSDEVSFFDVKNELSKLCAIADSVIDKKLVEKLISQHEKENVFTLMQMILSQNAAPLFHEAELILGSKDNNVIQVLSLLLRNYRISWKAALLGGKGIKEIGVPPKAVTYMSDAACSASMDCIQETISGIKMGKYKEQEGFILCLSKLMEYAKISSKSY